PDLLRAWTSIERRDAVTYRIDRAHPAVRQVIEKAGALTSDIEAMLRIIEETVPVQKIWLDTVEKGQLQQEPFAAEPPENLAGVLAVLYKDLRLRAGLDPNEARAQLLRSEPFHAWPALIEALPDNPF
ncbi:MAG: ATP-binding protein, partial [Hyphomicrobium sp.]